MLKNWKLQPDFIVNLRVNKDQYQILIEYLIKFKFQISDKDLTIRRIDQKVDPVSGNSFVKEMYAPKIKEPKVFNL